MRFVYPAELRRTGTDEIVVSFRDLPECLTSGVDEADALAEAADALDEAVAGRLDDHEPVPLPSPRRPGERKSLSHPERPRRPLLSSRFGPVGSPAWHSLAGWASMRKESSATNA